VLDGNKTYKVHLPPNIPAKDNWSFTLYDNQTRSCLQTDQRFPSVNSFDRGLVTNPDGSTDVWFSPTLPKGVPEANWAPVRMAQGSQDQWASCSRRLSVAEKYVSPPDWRIAHYPYERRPQTYSRFGQQQLGCSWGFRSVPSLEEKRFGPLQELPVNHKTARGRLASYRPPTKRVVTNAETRRLIPSRLQKPNQSFYSFNREVKIAAFPAIVSRDVSQNFVETNAAFFDISDIALASAGHAKRLAVRGRI
jgi:Protein of unknown function (DUF1214)